MTLWEALRDLLFVGVVVAHVVSLCMWASSAPQPEDPDVLPEDAE